jgi:hypothetical protein
MLLRIDDPAFVKDGEIWEVRDDDEDLFLFLKENVFAIQASVLFTLSIEYL